MLKVFQGIGGFPGGREVKNPPASVGNGREAGRSPGERKGSPLEGSCLEDHMDRGAWRVIVRGITEGQTWLSD